mgnify:FL=1
MQVNLVENIKELFRLLKKSRLAVAGILMVILFAILLWRMFYLQIISGEEYQNNYTLKIVKERTLNSTRGNIYDRNGKLLAYNELSYSITIEDNGTYSSTTEKNDALNAEIAQVITALEKNGDAIINEFKVDLQADGSYAFNVTGTAWKRFLADVYGAISYDDLKYSQKLGYDTKNATADQVMSYLLDSYGVSKDYDAAMAHKIVIVRFAMAQNAYQKYIATTIAENVSEESVAYIKEHSDELQGVDAVSDTIRKYNDSEYFASIIGYTGKISEKEYETLSAADESYTLNDVIGKGGIEQYMDSYLKGEKGYEKLYVDYMGKALEVIDRKEPTAGNDVYLSIDSDLQSAVYHLLEQEIAGIVYSNIDNPASEIPIPITDVYFALIDNNVIDLESFAKEDATENEREAARIFASRETVVKNRLSTNLANENAEHFQNLSEEDQDYFTYIINQLKGNGILIEERIDASDEIYQSWKTGEVSSYVYLNHAISKNWIDITQFTIEEKYSDSAEIYTALCQYILDEIATQKEFSKIIYEYLVKEGAISGRLLCLILFDQGVLPYNETEIAGLQNGTINAVTFLKDKIKNLAITPAQLALDPCSGSCVVTDTKTGEILALVSYPGYDSNRLANTVDAEYFNSLQTDKSLPQYNYATQQGTAPGSTFKMVLATAGLAENYITLGEKIKDLGQYENISNKPKCWIFSRGGTHGDVNVAEAIRDSCNYYFYEVGYRLSTNNYQTNYNDALGISKIQKYAAMFGFDEKTGIEIEEAEPRIADEFPVMAAIGQSNNRYTTVQLSRYITAVANKGTVYRYTLLDHVADSGGNTIASFAPEVRNTIDVLDTGEWDAIHSGMRMVVENTSEFNGFPVAAAGKTGTAQQNLTRANHALFVGYAPYENPEIAIATRIAYGYTSHNAAELSKNVLAYYFKAEDAEELLSGQAEEVNSTSSSQFSD